MNKLTSNANAVGSYAFGTLRVTTSANTGPLASMFVPDILRWARSFAYDEHSEFVNKMTLNVEFNNLCNYHTVMYLKNRYTLYIAVIWSG